MYVLQKPSFWKHLVNRRTLFSTLTVFAIFAAVRFSPGNIEIFDPVQNAISDFEFSDIVYSNFRSDVPVDTNVVIVNIGNLRRAQIAEQLRAINMFEPKAIGLTAFFRRSQTPEQDTPLVNALSEVKNIVMTAKLGKRDEEDKLKFDTLMLCHPKFSSLPNVRYGHYNFPSDQEDASVVTVRQIAPVYSYKDSLKVPALAVKLVELCYPEKAKKFLERGNDFESINYRGNINKFIVLDLDQMTPENLQIVRGKIVLMGFLGSTLGDSLNMEDKYWSPVSKEVGKSLKDMYGVVIHANIVSMLLAEEYIDDMSDWTALMLAVILCYVNIALFYYIEEQAPSFYGGIVKLIQFGEAIGLMFASIEAQYVFNYNIQVGLMLAVILLVPDLYELYDSSMRFLKTKLRTAPRLDQPIAPPPKPLVADALPPSIRSLAVGDDVQR